VFACEKEDDERCADLDDILSSKAQQASNSCEADVDCLVVEIHPGLFVASNGPFVDREADEVKARRVELCGEFEADLNVYSSICEEKRCLLEVTGMVDPSPDVDLPDGGLPDGGEPDSSEPEGGSCACSTDEDCGFGDLCSDGCNCFPVCDIACAKAQDCGKLEELRLGSDLQNCTERCEGFLEREGEEALGLLECLVSESCDALESCL
jgi:hypothetical protein